MNTADIFELGDFCVGAGFFPSLTGQGFVLGLKRPGYKRVIVHRRQPSFELTYPHRVWLMSGMTRVLLGDSHALPGDLSSGVRPPWTG